MDLFSVRLYLFIYLFIVDTCCKRNFNDELRILEKMSNIFTYPTSSI